jgi:hypothetical protein
MIPDNASPIRLTAAAGTYLAGAYSRGTVIRETLSFSLFLPSNKELYNPKAFIAHAASLHQAFAHCARFLTAASRRSLGRVSVPVWLIILSNQLPIIALVSRYLTNRLIGRKPLPGCRARRSPAFLPDTCVPGNVSGISGPFEPLSQTPGVRYLRVTHPFAAQSTLSPEGSNVSSHDLHVLDAPPAFVLSQDQTLRKVISDSVCTEPL